MSDFLFSVFCPLSSDFCPLSGCRDNVQRGPVEGLIFSYQEAYSAGVGGLWACISFAPIAQIVPTPEWLAERYVYPAHAGVALLIASLVLGRHKKGKLAAHLEKARRALSRALEEDPSRDETWQIPGGVLWLLGEKDAARASPQSVRTRSRQSAPSQGDGEHR